MFGTAGATSLGVKGAQATGAASGIGNGASVSRALTKADLGIKGTITTIKGTFTVVDDIAIVRVDMIEAEVLNPLSVIKNLKKIARAHGAQTLKIEGTLANEKLYNVLSKRYGIATEGSTETVTIPLY